MQKWTKSILQNTRPCLIHNGPNGLVSKVLIHLWWKRQIPVGSVGNGSNLNCSCLIVCSLFFQKIISRYISVYLIRETSNVFQDSTTSLERSSPSFWPHFETGIKNSKKNQKIGKPSHCVIICGQVPRTNNKLVIW